MLLSIKFSPITSEIDVLNKMILIFNIYDNIIKSNLLDL